MSRIEQTFAKLKEQNRSALVTFIMAGDPSLENSAKVLTGLPDAGADIIEIGMPFTDPAADGLTIQLAGQRALAAGANMKHTLSMVTSFRQGNNNTPIVLMGYANPIFSYGYDQFVKDAKAAGVDGLIVVDLPPEADDELCIPAQKYGIDFIRLATPTSDKKRLKKILKNASGFLYYVSVVGITGSKTPKIQDIEAKVNFIKKTCKLPIAVGFGIRTPEQAKEIANIADGVVVGSAIIDKIKEGIKSSNKNKYIVDNITNLVKKLSEALM